MLPSCNRSWRRGVGVGDRGCDECAEEVPATFLITGSLGAANPGILREEVALGMVLGNHTWTHADLTTLPLSQWPFEVEQTTALLQSFTGRPVACLRPPYGRTNSAVLAQIAQRRMAQLLWDVDPGDWEMPGASVIAQRVLSSLRPGAIVILHDGGGDRSQTVAALPTIVNGIRAAGYQLVTVC